jgi:Heterokaryon incompatibility protein (HET)
MKAYSKSFFVYSPLPTDSHIRLISIVPGLTDDNIEFQLGDVKLDQTAPYTALSYTWGDINSLTPVICNDGRIDVTTNLHNALIRLRHPKDQVLVWADAICINQEDVDERSKQVGLMGSIYANATNVIIWLREREEDTKLAFEGLRHLAALHQRSQTEPPLTDGESADIDKAQLAAIKKVFERPWFSRTWTFQEIVLAKDATIVCGDQRIPFSVCDEACQWIHYHDLQHAVDYLHLTLLDMSSTQQVLQSGDDTLSKETLRLRSLLSQTRFSEATDPRDKVYGLLGIAKHNGSIIPNYEMTKAEVYIQTARALIDEYEHLGILSNC